MKGTNINNLDEALQYSQPNKILRVTELTKDYIYLLIEES
jgi:hypothetical protein